MGKKYTFVSYLRPTKTFVTTVNDFNGIDVIFAEQNISINPIQISSFITFGEDIVPLNTYDLNNLSILDPFYIYGMEYGETGL